MRPRLKSILLESLKLLVVISLFAFLEEQVIQVRRDLQGSSNGVAEAQSRCSQELTQTRNYIRSALEDSNLQFTQARRVFEESTEILEGERRELERLIDDRTGLMASTLRDRLEAERSLIEGARTSVETNAALVRRLERALDHDAVPMKRRMIYPTVQLRGSGTVGSGVLVYSQPQLEGGAAGALTFILTAHHVVVEVSGERAAPKLVEEVRILGENDVFDPEVFRAELVICDRDRDLALLRVLSPRRFPHVAEMAGRDTMRQIDVFTRAYAVGCPLGNRPLPSVGEVSSKSKVVGDQVFWMLNAPTFFGNSGGGIYLAATGQLIGISSMIYTYGKEAPTVVPHMGLFVSLESIADWLDSEGYSFLVHRSPIPPSLLARYGLRKEEPPALKPAAPQARVEGATAEEASAPDSR